MAHPLVTLGDDAAVIDVTRPEYWQDPHSVLAEARRHGDTYRIAPFMSPGFLRFDDVEALLKDDRLVSVRTLNLERQGITEGPFYDWWDKGMLFNDPPVHTRLRGLVTRAFTRRRVESMRPVSRAICEEILDELAPRGSCELVRDFAHHVPIRVIARLLGVPESDYPTFAEWTAALSGGFNVIIAPPIRAEIDAAIVDLYAYCDALIEEKQRDPGDDLLTALIEAEEAGERLSREELKAMIVALLFAGHDTTKSLLTIGMKVLIDHPDVYRALAKDESLAEPVVEEIMRFESPAIGALRRAGEPFEHAGMQIAENDLVALSFLSAHRDERHYPNADRFDVGREDKRHLGFGFGLHFCVGNALGRLEAQEGLAALTRRLDEAAVEGEPRWIPFAAIRRYEALPLSYRAS